jgi:hypothetical protein
MYVGAPVALPPLVPPLVRRSATQDETPSRWQRARTFVRERVVAHPAFDKITLVFILTNCVFLALDNPLDPPESKIQRVLAISDTVRVRGRCSRACCRRRRGDGVGPLMIG